MHGAGGGAPRGNRNAQKHGRYSRESLEASRLVMAMARMVKETVNQI